MANVNYVNPGAGGTPYGDWKPKGALAGWQYADKMKDYRTTKDLSDESSFLANEMTRMTNEDYGRGADLRSVQREILRQRGGHELNRIPTEEGIKGMQANEQYSSLYDPRGREARIEKNVLDSINTLDTTKRKAAVDNTLAASTFLQHIDFDRDPNLALQQLEKYGVDISGLHDPDPNIIRHKLHKLRSIDPNRLKSEYERQKQADTDSENMKRLEKTLASQERVAGMKSQDQTSAEMKEKRLQEHEEVYVKARKAQGVPELQARREVAQMRLRDPYFQQGAAGQREVDTPQATLDTFEGKPTTLPNQAPGTKQTITLPEVGEVEIIEQLPDGGIKFKKGNRTGTWRP